MRWTRYEIEFSHRLGISRAAEAHFFDEVTPLLAEPIVCEQCDMCRWREWCGERLEDVADLSLITGVGVGRRALYKAHGVDDLHALAALDWRTAELFRGKVDVEGLGRKAAGRPAATPLAEVIGNRPKQVEVLAALGFETVGDLESIDAKTLSVCTAGASNAAGQIELARARVGAAPAYRKRGVDVVIRPSGRHRGRCGHGEHQRRLLSLGSARDGSAQWGADGALHAVRHLGP